MSSLAFSNCFNALFTYLLKYVLGHTEQCSGITTSSVLRDHSGGCGGGLKELYGMPGVDPMLAVCKTSSSVLLLSP